VIAVACWLVVLLFLLALGRAAAVGDRALERASRLRAAPDERLRRTRRGAHGRGTGSRRRVAS